MLIAQITDVHIGFYPGNPEELNQHRFDAMLDHLHTGPNRPDVLVITGDLVDQGDADSYARFAKGLARCQFPVHLGLGNHDVRGNFSAQFPDVPTQQGFVQYATDLGGLRLIMLDTLEEGRHAGAFCEARATWLKLTLAQAPHMPTLIAMHHPPVEVGIQWMATDAAEPWVARFADAIAGASQIKGIICGHLHRQISTVWRGVPLMVSASSSPQVTLDLNPIDAEEPDNRSMIVAEPPALAWHHWNGENLISYFDIAEPRETLARYNGGMQGLVRHMFEERPSALSLQQAA